MTATGIRHERFSQELSDYLAKRYGAARIHEDDLVRWGLFGDFERAWSLSSEFGEGMPKLIAAIQSDYPASLPKVIVRPAEDWHLVVPHVERNGAVCALPSSATADQSDLAGVFDHVIERTIDTLREGIFGSNRDDFIHEIESYWGSVTVNPHGPVWFVGNPEGRPRLVSAVHGGRFILVGDTKAQCEKWLRNYHSDSKWKIIVRKGLYLPHHAGIYPENFPEATSDVLRIVSQHNPAEAIKMASLGTGFEDMLVMFGVPTTNGTGMLAVWMKGKSFLKRDRRFHGHQPSQYPLPGFRAGKVSPNVFGMRFGKGQCIRQVVCRAYPSWIHGRGGALGMEEIRNKNVVLIGCGSLGSEVAQLLCNSGLGNLKLVDGERLSLDNIGRHLLGTREVGMNKAQALKKHLLGQFPHLNISAVESTWETAVAENGRAEIFGADLVVSLTGEWGSECALNLEARTTSKPPVIFGWTEPHGHAGHALLVGPRGGCLACGRDRFGVVLNRVTEWPDSQLQAVPACGGFFHPYGAIETGPIKAMIASQAVSALFKRPLGSELRTWLGDRTMVESLGGGIADDWLPHFSDPTVVGKIVVTPWKKLSLCPQCQAD